jgi:hypothetical protein
VVAVAVELTESPPRNKLIGGKGVCKIDLKPSITMKEQKKEIKSLETDSLC